MAWGRRIATVALGLAGLLLLARVAAVVYVDHAWYSALGAEALWTARAGNMALLYLLGGGAAIGFAYLNLHVVRRSIASLVLPRRVGNVEIAEAVTAQSLDHLMLALAIALGACSMALLPDWTRAALAGAGVTFGETDPYYNLDLGFFVAGLPFERDLYTWALATVAMVIVAVTLLYSFTPGLRWGARGPVLSTHVRRHLALLAATVLLLFAWSYRLKAYGILIEGGGAGGAFTYVDHRWVVPALIVLLVLVAAAALVIAWAGWTGQTAITVAVLGGVLGLSFVGEIVLPSLVREIAAPAAARRDAPYDATRAAYTARAYTPDSMLRHVSVDIPESADTGLARLASQHPRAIIHPTPVKHRVAQAPGLVDPPMDDMLMRTASAFALRRPELLTNGAGDGARVVHRAGVRERVEALAPMFVQAPRVEARFRADTIIWMLHLYTGSSTYPLSEHRRLAGREWSYFRHAGTAYVNAETGSVTIVPVVDPDPITTAWMVAYPAQYTEEGAARAMLSELTDAPRTVLPLPVPAGTSDPAFRARVDALYAAMRDALARGDFTAFGAALDSLGTLLGHRTR